MNNFLKNSLSTVVGLVIFSVLCSIFAFIGLAGMMVAGNARSSIKNNSVLVLNLQGHISDYAENSDDIMSVLQGTSNTAVSLSDMTSAIKKAKTDKHIKGIYIEAGMTLSNIALYEELRNTLLDFKKSGKWIIAYGERYSQGAYYVSSVADKIYINPSGMLDWHGLGSVVEFDKGLMKKIGVNVVVAKVGKFKGATEKFTEDKLSDANREQTERYLNGSWQTMLKDVSASRGIDTARLDGYADDINLLADVRQYKQRKLVDGFCYNDQIKDIVKKQLGIDKDDEIKQVSVGDMNSAVADSDDGGAVGVYYCQGEIVQSKPQQMLSMADDNIVCDDVIADLEKMAKNDDIKAIVLRINSGGGDAYASEQLWHEINKINKKKPVVVSMSGAAASGAYYMSMGSRWIVAEPTTLTGSIGIFAVLPSASELLTSKLGIKFDEVSTNKNSNFGTFSYARPMTSAEFGAVQSYVDRGYVLFRKRVCDGRKLSVDDVEKIAQGHVWLGTDAKKIKLVDEIGGLDAAVKKAASFAGVADSYHTVVCNNPVSFIEQILDNGNKKKDNYLSEQLKDVLGIMYEPVMRLKMLKEASMLQAHCPSEITLN